MSDRKKRIRYVVEHEIKYELEGDLDKVINGLLERRTKATEQDIINLRIEHKYDYDESANYELVGERLETDAEFTRRITNAAKAKLRSREAAKKAKLTKEKTERELLKKLKDKYENEPTASNKRSSRPVPRTESGTNERLIKA